MKRFFGRKDENKFFFEGSELAHMRIVLRLNKGDNILASCNDEYFYHCTLVDINKKEAVAIIIKKEKCLALPKNNLTLFIALPKKEYFNNILSKAIELGVNKIIPFESKFSQMKLLKEERVSEQVLTACKQCERSVLPEVTRIISFEEVLKNIKDFDVCLFAYEKERSLFTPEILQNKKEIAVIVGAEGGFSEEESNLIKNAGAVSVGLGNRILRCDTACIAMLSLVSILTGN